MEVTCHATTTEHLLLSLTVADFSKQIVTKFVHKIGQHEAFVLQDTAPEPLHKMRVAMRRLRTVLQVLEPLIILPDAFTGRAIGKLASMLGTVRDLDVMGEFLVAIGSGISATHLEEPGQREQQNLAKVVHALTRRRRQAFGRLHKHLAKDYRSLMIAGQNWIDDPRFCHQKIANQPIADVLPDLLLPLIGSFFWQGGWWVTTTELSSSQTMLHDLRKCTKRVRYQTECFAPYLHSDSQSFLPLLEASQECLGQMQDVAVLQTVIQQVVGKNSARKMPILSDRLHQKTLQAWQAWQPMRLQLCDRDWRQSFRQAVL
jgi:CHAD domain-containing protein